MAIPISEKVSLATQKDIRELESKIERFKLGTIPEEKFKAYRLTRGVYGQRQTGVQMFRIKIPFGKLTVAQLTRIADVSEKYTNGNLHTTTRQNIQYHFVKLDDSPAIWADLAEVGITAREACGNTVRTVTGSAKAGIDPDEAFDISPYAQALSDYFLRNPICQDMGRKIKMAFSSSDRDSAFVYFHDLGFIPKIKIENGVEKRGFKVLIGGGLGAQAKTAKPVFEFLDANKIIPFTAAVLRVFDRYGEREKRFKARLKFLVDDRRGIGIDKFLSLVDEELEILNVQTIEIDLGEPKFPNTRFNADGHEETVEDENAYAKWLKTNVFEQKQIGWFGVSIKLPLGNIDSERARKLSRIVEKFAADDIRVTVNQGFLLRYVSETALPALYNALGEIGLNDYGFNTIADITACPGSDTCNLAVTNSTGLAATLEHLLKNEFPELILDDDISIKMSGCMNSCGQHMAANIGFHGSSIKKSPLIIPAMQVVLGGGVSPKGEGFIAEKVIKLPTKRIPTALQFLLNDYLEQSQKGEYFNDYVQRLGKRYFFDLLKPLSDLSSIQPEEYQDWGQDSKFIPEIGVGECAGVMVDVVGAILDEAREKLKLSQEAYAENAYQDAVYHSYGAFIIGAKGLLLSEDKKCNAHIAIISDFEQYFIETGKLDIGGSFSKKVLDIKQSKPTPGFASKYHQEAAEFVNFITGYRDRQLRQDSQLKGKEVISSHYKA
ncbi:MAG: nitrite/sulfite reductase [Bacteroidota bacterium]